ncbi:MAG: rhomboid family intramembrane serine protease [Flavobacteriales bacterium]
MSGLIGQLNYQIRTADTLKRLIGINVLVFVVIRLTNAVSMLFLHPLLGFSAVSEWLAVPASVERLLYHPWTAITYMFVHWDFMHLLFNMLWLYWFGGILKEFLGAPKLLSTYLLGGLAGAFVYLTAYNTLPLFDGSAATSFAIGASASTMAITIAAATLLPDYSIPLLFFGPVRLKWIALITLLLDLINVSGNNAGGHIAHLGGAVFGFSYIVALRKGYDLSGWLQKLLFPSTSGRKSAIPKRPRGPSDEDFVRKRNQQQDRLDELLDKISKSGYESLTDEEKDFLFRASKNR